MFCAKLLPPVAHITRASLAFCCLHAIPELCSRIYSLFHAAEHSLLRSWNVLKEEIEKSLDSGKIEARTKSIAEFLEDTKKTLTDSGKGSWILVLTFLTHLFLLVFPIPHVRWRLLQRRPLKFNKENVTVILLLPWNSRENHFARCERLGCPVWLAAYSVEIHPTKGVTCLQLFKRDSSQ